MPFREKGRTAPLRARLQIQTAIRMIYWRRGTSSAPNSRGWLLRHNDFTKP